VGRHRSYVSKTLSTQSKGSSDVVSGVSRQQRKEDGNPPKELIAIAEEKGFCEPGTKAHVIVDWLKEDLALGHGHAMPVVRVIKNDPENSDRHVGSTGAHRDESTALRLDGQQAASRPGRPT
jgi:Domain of unknown function (DUF4287)